MSEVIDAKVWNGVEIENLTSASEVLAELTNTHITTAFPVINTAYTDVNAALSGKTSLEVPQSSLLALHAGEVAYNSAIKTVETHGIEQLAINFTDGPIEVPDNGNQILKEVWSYPVVNLNNFTNLPSDSSYKAGGSTHPTNPFAAPANISMIQDRIDDMISKNEWGFGAKVSVNHSKFFIDKLGPDNDIDNYTEVFLKLLQGTQTKSIFSGLPGVVKMYNTMVNQLINYMPTPELKGMVTGLKIYSDDGVEVSTIGQAILWAPVDEDSDRKKVIGKLIDHYEYVTTTLGGATYGLPEFLIDLLQLPIGVHPLTILGKYILGLSVDELLDTTFGEGEEMLLYKINAELETLYHSNEYLTYADVIKTVNTLHTKLPVYITNLAVDKAVADEIILNYGTPDELNVETKFGEIEQSVINLNNALSEEITTGTMTVNDKLTVNGLAYITGAVNLSGSITVTNDIVGGYIKSNGAAEVETLNVKTGATAGSITVSGAASANTMFLTGVLTSAGISNTGDISTDKLTVTNATNTGEITTDKLIVNGENVEQTLSNLDSQLTTTKSQLQEEIQQVAAGLNVIGRVAGLLYAHDHPDFEYVYNTLKVTGASTVNVTISEYDLHTTFLENGFNYIMEDKTSKNFIVITVVKTNDNIEFSKNTTLTGELHAENGKYNFVYVADNLDNQNQYRSGGFVVKITGSGENVQRELVKFTGLQSINSADLTVGGSTTSSNIPQLLKFLHDEIKLLRENVTITNSNNQVLEFASQYT